MYKIVGLLLAITVWGYFVSPSKIMGATFFAVRDGQAVAEIVVDATGAKIDCEKILDEAGQWLAQCIQESTQAELKISAIARDHRPSIIIARADRYPEIARDAKLDLNNLDAFCIAIKGNRLYILGTTELAARHAVAALLDVKGFRWFAPSPRWWIVPKSRDFAIDFELTDAPHLLSRQIGLSFGVPEKSMAEGYQRWEAFNRLETPAPYLVGHAYNQIVDRNRAEFEKHPEYFAHAADGTIPKREKGEWTKLCYTNPGLIRLAIADRIKLLEENRLKNPYARMVSMEASDGLGTCECPECTKLGSVTNGVIHLANQVAKGLREKYPDAQVGLYAYAQHSEPPTIDVEPNVYVQVATAFNYSKYPLPQLVEKWAEKVESIGLREFYSIVAWDFGIPGRIKGGHVDYHRKWIPFYAKNKISSIKEQSYSFWGGQMLGYRVASQLMWNPNCNVDALVSDFFDQCYGAAAEPMSRLQKRFDANTPLRPSVLLPMFQDLEKAYAMAENDAVRSRIIDMKSYLHYVLLYNDLGRFHRQDGEPNVEYYEALRPLMEYAWQTRLRGMIHSYALARCLCNGLPRRDQRLDFYFANKAKGSGTDPVWMHGEQLSDLDVLAFFQSDLERLKIEPDVHASYSSELIAVDIREGQDAGPSQLQEEDGKLTTEGTGRFRKNLKARLVTQGKATIRLKIQPLKSVVSIRVQDDDEIVLFKQEYPSNELVEATFEIPRAGVFLVSMEGTFQLTVPRDATFLYEASSAQPAWVDTSGPHYFYVPKGTQKLFLNCDGTLQLNIPGQKIRLDLNPAKRIAGKGYIAVDVPNGADGQVWHTSSNTRKAFHLLNVPPYLSFYRDRMAIPAEVIKADKLDAVR